MLSQPGSDTVTLEKSGVRIVDSPCGSAASSCPPRSLPAELDRLILRERLHRNYALMEILVSRRRALGHCFARVGERVFSRIELARVDRWESIWSEILAIGLAATGACGGMVHRLVPESRIFRIEAQQGCSRELVGSFLQVAPTAGVSGVAYRTRSCAFVEDVAACELLSGEQSLPALRAAHIRRVEAVPLLDPLGQVGGVLLLFHADELPLCRDEVRLLAILAEELQALVA